MSVVRYCRDPRAQLICAALINSEEPEKKVQFFEEQYKLHKYLLKWMPTTLVAHNAKFDLFFLYCQMPDLPWSKCKFVCTMNMAQVLYHAATPRPILSLDNLSKKLLKATGKTLDVKKFDGMSKTVLRGDLDLWLEMKTYVEQDVWLCYQLAKYLAPRVPKKPLTVIKWALHQFILPAMKLDKPQMLQLHDKLVKNRQLLLDKVDTTPDVLKSRPKFQALLESRGYRVPTKPSPSNKAKRIPQLAKTDDFIINNKEMDGELGDLIRCRLAFSSNLEITRVETWLDLFQHDKRYHYSVTPSGTFTHRLTGNPAGGGNPLNLPRKSLLRKAIVPAFKSKMFAGFDLSGLELRISRWVSNDKPAIRAIKNGIDLYTQFISECVVYTYEEILEGVEVEDPTFDRLRFIGKQCQLACQYGTSGSKLHTMLTAMGVTISLEECSDYVHNFRVYSHRALPKAWKLFEYYLLRRDQKNFARFPVDFQEEFRTKINIPGEPLGGYDGWVWPSGTVLRFPKLRQHNVKRNWYAYDYVPAYPVDMTRKDIYGSACFQAHIQSLANEVITDIRERLLQAGFNVVMECYDELTMVIDREDATEETKKQIQTIAEAPLSWWPNGPPLGAEVKFGNSYAEMK